jgi:hypothetical protein
VTQPQQDPLGASPDHITAGTAAAVARLSERMAGLDRQLADADKLTEARFVASRTLVDSQAEKVALALAAADKAVSKAEMATEKRFEAVNEFRGQLADQTRTFTPRVESDAAMLRLNERLQELTDRINRKEGQAVGVQDNRSGLYAALAAVAVVISVVIVVANFLSSQ